MLKKIFILSAISSLLFTTVYANNEMVTTNYCKNLQSIRKNTSYIIEANHKVGEAVYYKSYVKGNKWKTMTSYDGGKSYKYVKLYDGKNVYEYSIGDNVARLYTVYDTMKNDPEFRKTMIDSQNATMSLLDWPNPILLWGDATSAYFANKNDNRNGFNCTLIKFENSNLEFCINEKSGIAVYYKSPEMGIFDVVKIESNEISDTEFVLPKNMKIEKL